MSNAFGMVMYGDTVIRYRIVRKTTRRTLEIKIHPDVSITVTAPQDASVSQIADVVHRKAEWIIRNQWEIARLQRHYPRNFISGESYWYLGRQFALTVEQSPDEDPVSVVFCNSRFNVTVPDRWTNEQKRQAIHDAFIIWYRERAKAKLPDMVEHYAKRLSMKPQRIVITDMAQRWGSCGKNQVLRFNWRIIMASISLVEYVVAHETCHMRYKDHSKAFWKLLSSLLPDYDARRDRLAQEGGTFHL